MRTVRKIGFNKYFLGALCIILVFLYENIQVPEFQRQYWEEGEWNFVEGGELIDYTQGMEETEPGVLKITGNKAYLTFESEDLKGCRTIKIYLTELNDSGIDGYLTADGESRKIWITKGENELALLKPLEGTDIRIELRDAKGLIVNWDKIIFIKKEAGLIFPWTLFVLSLAACVFLLCSLKGKAGVWRIRGIFLTVFLLIFLQMRNVYYYFDDFGYLSLSYQNLLKEVPSDYGVLDVLEFLKQHYLHWGGRVLGFLTEIILGQNIWGLRIAQSVLTCGIFYLVYCVTKYEKNPDIGCLAAAMPFIGYMLLEVGILRDGAYWFTASVLYVFPIFWVLLGSILYYQACFPEREKVIRRKSDPYPWFQYLILFAGAFSQEQVSAALTGILFLITVFSVWKYRRVQKFQLLSNGIVWLGCGLLLFCPGSRARLSGEEAKGVAECIRSLIHILTADNTKYISWLMITASMFISLTMLRKTTSRVFRGYCGLFAAGSAVLLGIMIFGGYGMLTCFQTVFRVMGMERLNDYVYLLLGIYFIMMTVQILLWYFRYHKFLYLGILFSGGLATLAVAGISPDVSSRMMLPFYLLTLPVFCDIVVNFAASMSEKKECILALVFSAFLAVGALNYHYILYGYYQNSEAEESNTEILLNFWDYADDNLYIQLKKHKDDTFGNIMPYMSGYEWITEYMKKMYDIPENAIIRWKREYQIPVVSKEES